MKKTQGRPDPVYTTLDEWIHHEAIPFSPLIRQKKLK